MVRIDQGVELVQVICFGVLKTGKPDPAIAMPA
jgi:hypothetical protein